ncbi:MAG: type II secretion system major pseudopilin GspG [Candidatus Brocadiales bacterium]
MGILKCGDPRQTTGSSRELSSGPTRAYAPLKSITGRRTGFTLLELLIVIAIIGLLASVVAPKLIGRIGKSKTVIARAQIESFSTALETYRLDTGEYPSQGQGLRALIERPDDVLNWHGPYLRKRVIPDDPWGEPYIYRYPGEYGDYEILSYGADRRDGGKGEDADILSWE